MSRVELKGLAKQQLSGNWGVAVLATLVVSLITGAISGIITTVSGIGNVITLILGAGDNVDKAVKAALGFGVGSSFLISILGLIFLFVAAAFEIGIARFYFRLTEGELTEVKHVFDGFPYILKAGLLKIMMNIFVFLWSLLLVFPGIIAEYRYRQAMYILAENPDIGIMEAIRRSKAMMVGHKMELFVMDLSFIGWTILASIPCGIGCLWLAPYMNTTYVNYYKQLRG